MADTHAADDFDDLAIAAARLAGRVRAVRRAVESLATLAAEIAALRSALDALPRSTDHHPYEPLSAFDAGLSARFNGERPESPAPAPVAGAGLYSLMVHVAAQRGPVDLIRVVRALRSIPSLVELDLKHYTTGRAVLAITTSEAPETLPIRDALLGVFPAGVLGDWAGAREYTAVIAGAAADGAAPEGQSPGRGVSPEPSD